MRIRFLIAPAALVGLVLVGACSSAVSGSGAHASSSSPTTSTTTSGGGGFVAPSDSSSSSTSSPSPSSTLHPVPAVPLRTVTATGPDGRSYVLKIWAQVTTPTCYDHAYGQPMIDFLIQHPCRGLTRQLMTTVVNNRAVGLATSTTSFPGVEPDLYKVAGEFLKLVTANGTGNLNDLLREGYRLPSGPTSVPSPDAFNALGQDSGVVVYDMWYLQGPTPENDPALIKLSQDIFLQF